MGNSKRPAVVVLLLVWGAGLAGAQTPALEVDPAVQVQVNLNIVWTVIAAGMVFFMQLGFAMVEAGFTQAKNAVNIIMKNLMDFSLGAIAFFLVGFGLMFGHTNGWFGTSNFALSGATGDDYAYTFLLFQTVFAATAATIVSGAMAERTKFTSYMIYSVFITMLVYPIFGSWAWGGLFHPDNEGWLERLGFVDFAGSTVVHSVGGWLALAGALVLGPRLGKYGPDGRPRALPGHNIPLAALGVFILWFGWFGFNAGSTTVGDGAIGRIAVTTNLAAAAGALVAMIVAWWVVGKPDASMTLNGALAGLVAITAGCASVTPIAALLIGATAGALVVVSVLLFDGVLRVDDPVGAVSVHGVCGVWGTLAVGLFQAEAVLQVGDQNGGLFYGGGFGLLLIQLAGAAIAFAWAFGVGLILFLAVRWTVGLRVTAAEERRGLDIGEHGMEAYYGFQFFTTQ